MRKNKLFPEGATEKEKNDLSNHIMDYLRKKDNQQIIERIKNEVYIFQMNDDIVRICGKDNAINFIDKHISEKMKVII